MTRRQAAADALGSVRAEGLDPGRAEEVLAAWASGEISDEQLEEVRSLMLTKRELTVRQLLDCIRSGDSASGAERPGAPSTQ